MKIRCLGLSIVFLLLFMLATAGHTDVNESNITDYLSLDCVSIANFIEENFDIFVHEYNNSIDDETMVLNATYVEAKKNVTNVTDDTKAVYLDFDGDNGYAVIGNEYTMLDFATTGDLDYLKDEEHLLYSKYDGFVYETEDGYKSNYVASKYYASLILLWSFESQVKSAIDDGVPAMFNTSDGQYGAHSVVVIGYRQFYKVNKFWFITWYTYKNLMILNDNWRTPSEGYRYFDLDAFRFNWFEGLGTFLKVRNYSF